MGDVQCNPFVAQWLFSTDTCAAMFSLFKRSAKSKVENDFSDTLPIDFPAVTAQEKSPPAHTPVEADMPLVEVSETADDDTWAAWQDSVTFQDSQFAPEPAPLHPESSAKKAAPDAEIDPFSSVGKYAP